MWFWISLIIIVIGMIAADMFDRWTLHREQMERMKKDK